MIGLKSSDLKKTSNIFLYAISFQKGYPLKKLSAAEHYNALALQGDDPANDPPALANYMAKWDGTAFMRALKLCPQSNVLEIGVGTGRLAQKVLATGCRYFTGIDISAAAIAKAKENLARWNNVSLIHADFIKYDFCKIFDIVYCSLTLFHFKDKTAFIRKVASLLALGGIFVASIPKEKQFIIAFDEYEVDLYPDDLYTFIPLLHHMGLRPIHTTQSDFAHIIVAERC